MGRFSSERYDDCNSAPSASANRRIVTVAWGRDPENADNSASASIRSRSRALRGGRLPAIASVRNAGSSESAPYRWAEDLNTSLRTDEPSAAHAARIRRVPMTLISRARLKGASSGSATRRVSITVSIDAALRIRRSSAGSVSTRTNSVRWSSWRGSVASMPTIASTADRAPAPGPNGRPAAMRRR